MGEGVSKEKAIQLKGARQANRVKTLKKQAKAVDLYIKERGQITNVCRRVRVHRSTFNKWMKQKEFNHAIALADNVLDDKVERVMINKAMRGATGELLFYLKKRHKRYMDQPTTIGVRGDNVEVVIQDYKGTK